MNFEIQIWDIRDYIQVISDINEDIKGKAVELIYRGQSDNSWPLLPGIGRKEDNKQPLLNIEENLVEIARYKIPQVFDKEMLPISRLALMQHYGLPTRLLDVTTNPLVAIYFACKNEAHDAEVLVFERQTNDVVNAGVFQAIAETYHVRPHNCAKLNDFYDQTLSNKYPGVNETDEDKAICISFGCDMLMVVRSPETIERQKAQSGSYILFPNKIEGEDYSELHFVKAIEEIPKNKEHLYHRIIIPKSSKRTVMQQLKRLDITESTLFPDSIDAICRQILRDERERNL